MELDQLEKQRNDMKAKIDELIEEKKVLGGEYIDLNRKYRYELTTQIAILSYEGLNMTNYRTSPVPFSIAKEMAYGITSVCDLEALRDTKKMLVDYVQEQINSLKLDIKIRENDIVAIRQGR